jgi:hypothetical protein
LVGFLSAAPPAGVEKSALVGISTIPPTLSQKVRIGRTVGQVQATAVVEKSALVGILSSRG